ncbi:tRNA pseudouridine(13) synthase TruD [Kaarinaea lacus]
MSHLSQLLYASGQPDSTAAIRRHPEDFQVTEQLSFDPVGEGQHIYLLIEKHGLNTEDVARLLARFVKVLQVAVGYAGLKDRHAITRQWFSVDLAGKPEPDWHEFNTENIRVIETIRHNRKLKRGAIRYNQFQIALRKFSGDKKHLEQRLECIQQQGVPNYFGEQRFGRNDANLMQAEKLFSDESKRVKRHLRGIYLSAVRAFLFNQVLSQRVADQTWNHPINGDVFMLEGSHSVFSVHVIDTEIVQRINEFDIHPTGPMWGSGTSMATGDSLAIELKALQSHQAYCEFLVKAGLKQERRALRVKVSDLSWEWQGEDVVLRFKLPTGCYATAALRELVLYG